MKYKAYTYVDGNNNTYVITSSLIDYRPVSKEMSSSGEYSGGEPKKKVINQEQFDKIEAIMLLIRKDKTNYIENRSMGCGTLYVKGNKRPIFIKSSSKYKSDLERELQELILGI